MGGGAVPVYWLFLLHLSLTTNTVNDECIKHNKRFVRGRFMLSEHYGSRPLSEYRPLERE